MCPECATDASVGVHCPECLAQAGKGVRKVKPRRLVAASATSAVIAALNVAVWGLLQATGTIRGRPFTSLALHPEAQCLTATGLYLEVPRAACVADGGWFSPGVSEGAYWQLLTSAFTHYQPLHLLFNMVALWVLGPQVEAAIGRGRYLALYFLSALAGSVAVYWLADPSSTTLGASGAVFGLMGALAVLSWKFGGNVRTVLIWVGANLAFTFVISDISWQGHLGGLAGGLAVTGILLLGRRRPTLAWSGLAAMAAVLVVLTLLRTAALA